MKHSIAANTLSSVAFALFLAPASAQFQAASVGGRPDAVPAARPDNGCPGLGFRPMEGALVEHCSAEHVSFFIQPLASAGGFPSYQITGPPGADVFLMMAPGRAWREFPASEGVLHLGLPLNVVSLGPMPASGSITRPFPAPRPAWRGAFASVELQVYARVAGQDRYSEPRTLQVIYP